MRMLCSVCEVFSAVHSARVVGEVEVHLRRGLGAGRHLELDAHPVDRELLPGVGDVDRRRDERGLARSARSDRGPAPICPSGPFASAAPYM